jgi:hypothetical protein
MIKIFEVSRFQIPGLNPQTELSIPGVLQNMTWMKILALRV